MNIEMKIFFFWYSTLIQWAEETQLSIQSIMTLRSWMKLLKGNKRLFLNVNGGNSRFVGADTTLPWKWQTRFLTW